MPLELTGSQRPCAFKRSLGGQILQGSGSQGRLARHRCETRQMTASALDQRDLSQVSLSSSTQESSIGFKFLRC